MRPNETFQSKLIHSRNNRAKDSSHNAYTVKYAMFCTVKKTFHLFVNHNEMYYIVNSLGYER